MSQDSVRPQQFQVKEVTIDGQDVKGIYQNIEIFENIYLSAVTGSITILDTDGGSFIEKNKIEFNEDFSFSATGSGQDNNIKFNGVLNGLRTEYTKDSKRVYVIDFTTQELRNNEQSFVTKKFTDESPENVIRYCLEKKLEAKDINIQGITGKPMNFIGSRRKPFWVIKFALTHGVVKAEAGDGKSEEKKGKKLKGASGFLCWQVLSDSGQNAYRGSELQKLVSGGQFETHTDYGNKLVNNGLSLDEQRKNIVDFNFQTMGDVQTNMKSGAMHSKVVSFDLDVGLYKEYTHKADDQMTEKQKKIFKNPSRFLCKNYTNERFSGKCDPESPNKYDQSRDYLAQNNSSQNSFNDQSGTITLYNLYGAHAGDMIDLKMNKVKSEGDGMSHEKHSGKYLIKQVCHVFSMGGDESYTQLTLLRSSNSEQKQ